MVILGHFFGKNGNDLPPTIRHFRIHRKSLQGTFFRGEGILVPGGGHLVARGGKCANVEYFLKRNQTPRNKKLGEFTPP